mmetsp:Transcript_10325/g.12523  ORF Transcript_10325/g.12523 Transcript_10325/m.12523 type:complete len:192 (-) Transcript_10325:38-613(-)|eukprot:CAMPEP_0114347936 /NCGR_PEP_ID=MMETSP0101-20121206/14327_1 /TAXON_ID=38822 ORGANISM="Pteridomonas danica, Strain PT" /NCGR_SAMPLE_ID=MMETSP0101 /ASSEMBLY_ACC=CAM_ASM_000211 /LENGTH=191 /DNA_ID=CAMNT_0001485601 /DNA_START=42 /DNA_END=617 /DNA_ORIENTATION=-
MQFTQNQDEVQLLAVTIPGRQMQLGWRFVSENRAVLSEPILMANEVPDVMISILPGCMFFGPDQAACIYWSSDGQDFSLLGALSHQLPSSFFRTGWGTLLQPGTTIQLAISIEPMDVATNLGLGVSGEALEDRKSFAAAIARDLWTFLTSFAVDHVQSNGSMMLVPTTVLDRWMERFNAKFARDPNFMLKE